MSRVIRNLETGREDQTRTLVKHEVGKFYVVDSCDTPDHGWETIVVPAIRTGEVKDWRSKFLENFATKEEMMKKHTQLCNELERYC